MVRYASKAATACSSLFVAAVYLSMLLCIVALVAAIKQDLDPELLVITVLAFTVMLLCRCMLVRVTREWSLVVQGIVNIGRKKLAATLGLQLPPSLEAEKRMWGHLTAFVFYGRNGELLDAYRAPAAAAPGEHAKNAGGAVNTADEADDRDADEAGEADDRDADEAGDRDNVASDARV
jgi:hypothetical protein